MLNIWYYCRPVVFSFDSPQEYSADFVMATLATTTTTTTTGDITADHHAAGSTAAAAASTTKSKLNNNHRPTASVSKQQKLSANHSDIVATPSAAVSIAETPKDGNPVPWLQERTTANDGTSDHHNGETVGSSRPVEEFVTHSHDAETDNLLDSLFDDIINDDIADNVYGFTHQHPHTNTGKLGRVFMNCCNYSLICRAVTNLLY